MQEWKWVGKTVILKGCKYNAEVESQTFGAGQNGGKRCIVNK